MHFLVFVPDAKGPEALAAVGLDSLSAGAEFVTVQAGPTGGRGIIFGWPVNGQHAARCSYRPEEQDWIPAAHHGDEPAARYFIGFWKDSPPRAGELARRRVYGGISVTLGDGCEWTVPACRDLPHAMRLLPGGEWGVAPTDQFAPYVVAAKHFELQLLGDARPGLIEQVEFAIRALSLNYRLTREVASHLQLFTTSDDEGTLRVCFRAAIGAGEEA